MTQYTVYSK
uniref:Uncharacterized protein n=1 Tax=Anguilla anguilla TaxID=7936 RepID=A0A0E9QL56_ANGAN